MKQNLVRILRDIFTSSGYDVSDSFRYDLVTEKNGAKTFIRLSYNPDVEDVRDFAGQISEGKGLYIMAGEGSEEILRQAKASGLNIWSRDDMALKIGRAVLADMEGTTSELDLLEPTMEKPAKNNVDEVAKEAINAIFGTGSSPHVEKKVFEAEFTSKPPKKEPQVERVTEVQYYRPGSVSEESFSERSFPSNDSDEQEVQEEPPVEASVSSSQARSGTPIVMNLHSSPVKVSLENAFSIAAVHVSGASDAMLKFVPFWKYSYSLGVEHRYRSKIVDISGNGSGCMNALNGNIETMHLDAVQKTIEVPDVEYDVKMPVTSEEEAKQELLDMIIEEHTRDIRFDDTQGEAIISEHKRFKPAPSDINLEMELAYVPVWDVKGLKNSVEINAYNGDVLKNPVDDDVEFV